MKLLYILYISYIFVIINTKNLIKCKTKRRTFQQGYELYDDGLSLEEGGEFCGIKLELACDEQNRKCTVLPK